MFDSLRQTLFFPTAVDSPSLLPPWVSLPLSSRYVSQGWRMLPFFLRNSRDEADTAPLTQHLSPDKATERASSCALNVRGCAIANLATRHDRIRPFEQRWEMSPRLRHRVVLKRRPCCLQTSPKATHGKIGRIRGSTMRTMLRFPKDWAQTLCWMPRTVMWCVWNNSGKKKKMDLVSPLALAVRMKINWRRKCTRKPMEHDWDWREDRKGKKKKCWWWWWGWGGSHVSSQFIRI